MEEPVEPATILERPLAKPTIAQPPPDSIASVATSARAQEAMEAERMRGLMIGIAASSVVVMVIVILLGGDPDALQLHAGALGVSSLIAGGCALLFRNPQRYYPRLALYVILAQVVVLVSGYYFWGAFSAYGALVPLTIYVAVGTASKTEAVMGVGVCVIAQGGFALATVLGWIEPRGLVEPVAGVPESTQLIAIGLLQAITIGAAIAGWQARRDSAAVLERHNKALVELARREAQLAEAYADARAVRDAAVGGVGRFSEQTIDGLRLGEVLGRGAMGEVYAAQRDDNHDLAVKLLAPHLLRDRASRERFLRESAIVASIASPHVVRVLGVSPADAALPYIVMERLQGTDLGALLKKTPVLPLHEVTTIAIHVGAGLDAAHKAGIIHRDLKPSNIYAIGEGRARIWKLLDFGASKWRDGEGTLTQDQIVGTPGYMSPEQAMGKSIDQRSDVYAFGCVLYRLVAGAPAVVPGELPVMLQEVVYRMPVQPSKRATVSPQIEAVLAVALAKSPVHRFATAGELATVFVEATAGKIDRGIAHRAEALLEELSWGGWDRK
jgi:eukaryotic-like serine/threonine-protein kinase